MTNQKAPVTDQEEKSSSPSLGTKSFAVAALLFFTLGMFGAHRLYLGKVPSGLTMAAFTIFGLSTIDTLIGNIALIISFVWWIYDIHIIYYVAKKHNEIQKSRNR